MLPKEKRLNLKKDYRSVTSGKKFNLQNATVFLKEGEERDPLIGIALSKAQFKKANERNRAKRLMSQAIERSYKRLRQRIKLVIIPKASILNRTPEELEKELESVRDIFKVD